MDRTSPVLTIHYSLLAISLLHPVFHPPVEGEKLVL
jgi:hypothetical protein